MASLLLPKLGITTIDAAAISQDQAVVDAYLNDPLVYKGRVRARLGAELVRAYQQLRQRISWINLPVLIMHGAADRLCEPDGSQMLYEQVSSEDKALKLYQDFYHEIFNEPGYERVLADIETWLAARV
jgi:alpha-beta hydrolase superfamily lysophospholipase